MFLASMNALAACILGLAPVGPRVDVADEMVLPHNLVQAQVTKVVFDGGRCDAVFEVTHIYKGDADLLGKKFSIKVNTTISTLMSPMFNPPLKLRDTVIWLLRREGDSLEYVVGGVRLERTRHRLAIPVPARQGEDWRSQYSDALAFAKAVEKTVNTAPHQRYALLEELALSETRRVATWAMYTLVEADPKRGADFLRQLLRGAETAVVHKILADQVLSALDETGWKTSRDRLALYRRWVAAPLPEDAAELLVDALNEMFQHPPFPIETVEELLEGVIRNEKLAVKSPARATSVFHLVPRHPEQRKRVFELMLHLLIDTDIPEIEFQAARVLRHTLHEEVQQHRDHVLGALPSVQDKTAAMLLQEALEKD